MLQKSTLQFLTNIQKNNNKIWMDANKNVYLDAKTDWENFVQIVINNLSKHIPQLADIQAKQCTFRLNRDVRFSKNKEPYKNNFGASIKIGGKKSNYSGFYIHLQPDECFVGGGFYMPEPATLLKIRQEIDYNLPEFEKIITNKKFLSVYTNGIDKTNSLVNIPKGYEITNPASEYLKLKSFTALAKINNSVFMEKDAEKNIANLLFVQNPFIEFLNRCVD